MVAESFAFPDSVVVARDVVYGEVPGRQLRLNILRPRTRVAKTLPVVVWVHGGGWMMGAPLRRPEMLVPLVGRDFFVAAMDSRFSQDAPFPAQIEDCKCAIRYLRAHAPRYGIDPERIGAWGSSAGGHLVALLGTAGDAKELEGTDGWPESSSRVQAVVDWYGPTDLLQMGGTHNDPDSPESRLVGGTLQEHKEAAAKANPMTYVSQACPPFLIMHGTEDTVVPPNQSEILHAALQQRGVNSELVMVPGKGHEPLGEDANQQVYDFFSRHLSA